MFCMKCGSPVNDHARFCGKCGVKISGEAPDATVQPQPGLSQSASSYQLKIKGYSAVIEINGEEKNILKGREEVTYIINTNVVAIKISPKVMRGLDLTHPLELKLQLYSNAELQFSIIPVNVGKFEHIDDVLLENLSGAMILR